MHKTSSFLFLLSLLLLTACAAKTEPQMDAGYYFQEGEAFFAEGRYKDAVASWEKVRESYLSPELNTLAELKIAEAHFLNDEYVEAAVAYGAFFKSHPDHPRVPDVLYQMGLSYMYQILKPDQDQTSTVYALDAFKRLQERFPGDRRMQEVNIYINRCQNQLADSELSIAQFYLRTKYYSAAINRFEGLLKKYPSYYQLDKAYFFLGQAYLLIGENDKAEAAFNTLLKDHVGSEFIADAQQFIEDNN
jgi:outer membrane protein assembly factor BamD